MRLNRSGRLSGANWAEMERNGLDLQNPCFLKCENINIDCLFGHCHEWLLGDWIPYRSIRRGITVRRFIRKANKFRFHVEHNYTENVLGRRRCEVVLTSSALTSKMQTWFTDTFVHADSLYSQHRWQNVTACSELLQLSTWFTSNWAGK